MLPGTAEERSKFGLEAVFRGANGLRVVAEGACPWVHSGRLGLAVEPDVLVTDHLRQQVVVRVVVQRRDLKAPIWKPRTTTTKPKVEYQACMQVRKLAECTPISTEINTELWRNGCSYKPSHGCSAVVHIGLTCPAITVSTVILRALDRIRASEDPSVQALTRSMTL